MPQLYFWVFMSCLYLSFIYLLTTVVAPILVVGLTIVLSATVSWLCANIFWKTYLPEASSKVGLVAITTMLLMLYSDFLLLLSFALSPTVGPSPLIQQIVGVLPSGWLISFLGTSLGLTPYGITAIVLAIVSKGLLLPVILLAFRGLDCSDPDPVEPAFLSYFQKAAFRDLREALRGCVLGIPQHLRPIANWITKNTLGGKWVKFLWPLGIAGLLALIPPLLFATVFLGSVVLIYGVGLFMLQTFNRYFAFLLYLAERLVMKIRAGYAKCPHAGCYEPLPLPTMVCPGCGSEHLRLLPGRTGVFYRACRCGEKLPTLFLLGKGSLPSRCPHCKGDLPDKVFGANLHFPIYGGPEAGKTSFMAASVAYLVKGAMSELQTSWLRDRDRIEFEQRWQQVLDGGPGPLKTTELLPNAYLISLQRQNGLAASLYLYDPAGEAFDSGQKLSSHRFMEYCSGLILIVDPLSFPEVLTRIEQESAPTVPRRSAIKVSAREVFDRVVQQLEGLERLNRTKSSDQPVAVIVTKGDLRPLCRELGADAGAGSGIARSAGELESARTRSWLELIDSAFVHGLETRFRNVRYFAVAALPEAKDSVLPRESVLAPLSWLFSWQPVLAQPELTRWKWGLLEVAAFGGVALTALTPPILLAFFLLGFS